MKLKNYLDKYRGEKAHFDLDPEGYYLLDFTGRSYTNVDVLEVHDEFVILYDQVDKSKVIVPYARLLVRFLDEKSTQ